jgi:hypothetical protein
MELDCFTDSHVKLNSLDDMQELLNNYHHKIAFNYYEDTMSFSGRFNSYYIGGIAFR